MTTEQSERNGLVEASRQALANYPDSVDVETGQPLDDWGFSDAQREAFVAGFVWARKGLLSNDDAATAIERVVPSQWGMPIALGLRLHGIRLAVIDGGGTDDN